MLSIFVVLTNVVLLKTSSCWMGFSHLNSQNSLEKCQIAFSSISEQNKSQNWSFFAIEFFLYLVQSSVCQLWYDSISWYAKLTFEEFCWVSKVCFGYALFCLSNGVSPLLNNQLDLLCSVKIERSGTKEQSRRLPSQILFSEREVYRKSHNACSHLCNKMNLLNILKLKSRNLSKSHATCHCVIPHPLSQKLFHLRSWLAVKRSYFYFSSFLW